MRTLFSKPELNKSFPDVVGEVLFTPTLCNCHCEEAQVVSLQPHFQVLLTQEQV